MAISNLNIILFFLFCFFVPSILAKPVTYCDRKGNYPVKVKEVEFKPDPVKPGQEAVFSISASSMEPVSGGEVMISVKYSGIRVHSETIDLCAETECPVSAGDFVLSHKQALPIFTPPGHYTLNMKMKDNEGGLLTCINFGFKIGFGSSVSDS